MDTFRLVLGQSGGTFTPIVFRLEKSGPDHVLCMKGNFGKGPLILFGLRTGLEPAVCVYLDQVFAVSLIRGIIVRMGTLTDGPYKYQGLSIPGYFLAHSM